ncbi:MAG: RpiB/LacA/LacB family sugar-phosphate isomerase [Candidatus Aenigmarchaeota archaeon]|nr:RpiB/LacA/LacB family sugar-phosphate isomerase [Candidatus Aenigmarchaeota archaeon]
MTKIYIGSDHNGFLLKQEIKKYLKEKGFDFEDLGNAIMDKNDDYPEYAFAVAKKVGEGATGILLCGSGHGMAIAANKIAGVRAVCVSSADDAKSAKSDDNANLICLSGWALGPSKAKEILNAWFSTEFSGAERHKRRLAQIERMERK